MKIHFYLDRRKGMEKKLPVFLHYWHEGELLRVFTGEHCNLEDWDKKRERIKDGVSGAVEVNKVLTSMENEVFGIIKEAKLVREPLTVKDLRRKLTFVSGAEKDFFKIWDEFMNDEASEKGWKDGTIKRMNVVKNHLLRMNRYYRINLRSINKAFYRGFIQYHTDQGYRISYARRNLDILKWFLNWAARKGYSVSMDYKKIKPLKEQILAQPVKLDPDELMKLVHYKSDNKELILARDVFVFGCLTGLGYSEISQLTSHDIKNDHIIYTPRKTNRKIEVPMVNMAKVILEKYTDRRKKYLLTLPPIQNYNLYLKQIGREAGLTNEVTVQYAIGDRKKEKTFKKWELLSSKVARKTFINLGALKGIGLEVMSELSGYLPGTIKSFYQVKSKSVINEINKLDEIYNSGNTSI